MQTTVEITLPPDIVETIADEVADVENPDHIDVVDRAYSHVELRGRFLTESGRPVAEVVTRS
jgi:hypothetical protein